MPLINTLGGLSGRNYGARLTRELFLTLVIPTQTIATGYSYAFTPAVASGGNGSIVYSVSTLPSGLSINSSTGEISGTTTAGASSGSYTITATDKKGISASVAFDLTVTLGVPTVIELMLVGSGGGAAYGDNTDCGGGGGGAGGVYYSTTAPITVGTSYTITIGGGGGSNTNAGSNGSDVTFGTGPSQLKAYGGGYGAIGQNGGNGGSGGGTSRGSPLIGGIAQQPISPWGGYGYNGGTGSSPINSGGAGGGGSGGAGSPNNGDNGGGGGAGLLTLSSLLTAASAGVSGRIAAGGGGGGGSGSGGGGGAGGGGPGGAANSTGTAGTQYTGSGGGGGGRGGAGYAGGNGGSGLAIIRMPSDYPVATTTGSPTVVISGSDRIYKFLGSGSITFSGNPA